jgi:hypothetical protein
MTYHDAIQMLDKKNISAGRSKNGHLTFCSVCKEPLLIHKSKLSDKAVFECTSGCKQEDIIKAFEA